LAVFAGGSGHLHHTGPHFGDIHVVVLSRVTGCRSAPPVSPPAGDARHVSSRRGHGVDGQHPSGQAPPRGTRDKTRKPPDSLPHGGVISGVWESLPLLRLVILANKRMTDTEFCHHESFDAGPSARSWRWLRFRRAPHSIEQVRGFRPRQSPEIPHRLITTACGMHGIRDLAQRACRQ